MTGDRDDTPGIEAPCGIAFKEWEEVCERLDRGDQCVIVRKGGIAEEGGLFVPEHSRFWLYPTRVHQAEQGAQPRASDGPRVPPPASSAVTIRNLALVEAIWFVDRAETLPAVASLQNLPLDILERRFHYRRPGLWVLSVRILRRPDDAILVPTPEQAGCKSWVTLSEPLSTRGLVPVLPDDEFAAAKDRAAGFLGRGITPELGEETS